MAKALLIAPASEGLVSKRVGKFHRRFPPLSLLITASVLRERGWEVELNDLNANPHLSQEKTLRKAEQADCIILTTNPYADWQCPSSAIQSTLDFARQLPSDRLVLTGNHGSHYPGGVLKATNALVAIREEPEWRVLETAEALRGGVSLASVAGISYREGTEIYHNAGQKLAHMDKFLAPAYDLVDLEHYYYELLGSRFALLEASRGCPYSCSFCNLSMFQGGYRKRSPKRLLEEIDQLVLERGCRSLYIFDLEFTINRKMTQTVCQHLIEKDYAGRLGFRWACQTRADSVDEKQLALMKQSGCELIHFGVESGNPETLSKTNKKITKQSIREGIAATQRAGIQTAAFFIVGFPGETLKHYQQTLDFALELNPTFASFHPLMPFPGSPLFTEKYGAGPYWDEPMQLDQTFFTAQQERLVSQFVKKAYLRFYLRPGYIWQLLIEGHWTNLIKQFKLFRSFLSQS